MTQRAHCRLRQSECRVEAFHTRSTSNKDHLVGVADELMRCSHEKQSEQEEERDEENREENRAWEDVLKLVTNVISDRAESHGKPHLVQRDLPHYEISWCRLAWTR